MDARPRAPDVLNEAAQLLDQVVYIFAEKGMGDRTYKSYAART